MVILNQDCLLHPITISHRLTLKNLSLLMKNLTFLALFSAEMWRREVRWCWWLEAEFKLLRWVEEERDGEVMFDAN